MNVSSESRWYIQVDPFSFETGVRLLYVLDMYVKIPNRT